MSETYQVGESVFWRSQSRGYSTLKKGTIVGIVPAGVRPSVEAYPGLYSGTAPGMQRREVSYVVLVGKKLYWPLVINLRMVNPSIENTLLKFKED